ncbi:MULTISPECIES: sensor histidine kinase [unclassified Nocardioides]|uniref:sensor histidine kinase n=1 Tax=unclassified Nocardioides TaxID=2615069 RepID=UPI001E53FFAC|nr:MULTISPECIES: sensor histidine kinase [unclassified Nocardioides]
MSTSPAAARPAHAGRLRLTSYAAWQLACFVPAVLLVVASVLGGVLALLWIGIPVLLVAIPATRWLADRHRRMAERVLGTAIPEQYRPAERGPVPRVLGWARDPMTWRDLGWLLWTATFGFALSLLVVLLLVLVVTGGLWYFGVEPLMRARSVVDRWFLSVGHTERLEQRVQELTVTRADAVDHSAAELRRLERDLHDGTQARLVALSMHLGMAESTFADDPDAARRLVADARASSVAAIGDLRAVLRGLHPPVLADRGLGGAVEALALDLAVPVRVDASLAGRPPAPVESAVYFALAECLANVVKHAGAEHAWVRLTHADGVLRGEVGDDGVGGADPRHGTGMLGVMRRLGAFDGTMAVASPTGGPTLVTVEVPCALSSPRTTPSSGPA